MSDAEKPLFERIGGETAIMAAVSLFYEKVLEDAELAPFFDGMDMPKLIHKQVAFMTMAFDGPHNYSGRELADAHRPLVERGLNDDHFDRVAVCLKDSLEELSVSPALISEALAIVETTRAAVLCKEDAVQSKGHPA